MTKLSSTCDSIRRARAAGPLQVLTLDLLPCKTLTKVCRPYKGRKACVLMCPHPALILSLRLRSVTTWLTPLRAGARTAPADAEPARPLFVLQGHPHTVQQRTTTIQVLVQEAIPASSVNSRSTICGSKPARATQHVHTPNQQDCLSRRTPRTHQPGPGKTDDLSLPCQRLGARW
jgi:hypothetical protein